MTCMRTRKRMTRRLANVAEDEVSNDWSAESENLAEARTGSSKARRKKKVSESARTRETSVQVVGSRTSELAATTPEAKVLTVCTSSEEVCQTLLRECMRGNYDSFPTFATTVWDWFVETEASCPRECAFLVGQKAMKLLSCLDTEAFVQETAQEWVGGSSGLSCITLALAGMCVREPYVWSGAAALVACRVAHAWRIHTRLHWPLLVCGGSALILATLAVVDSVWLAVLHASVWYIVACWQCGLRWSGGRR